MEKEDFRIKEYDGRFIIQRKVITIKTIFKIFKVSEYYQWVTYDDNTSWQGRIINIDGNIKTGYTSLETATDRLKKILEEPKYHYL